MPSNSVIFDCKPDAGKKKKKTSYNSFSHAPKKKVKLKKELLRLSRNLTQQAKILELWNIPIKHGGQG